MQPAVENIVPEFTRPVGIHRVRGDGDCLFTSFSRIVSGTCPLTMSVDKGKKKCAKYW